MLKMWACGAFVVSADMMDFVYPLLAELRQAGYQPGSALRVCVMESWLPTRFSITCHMMQMEFNIPYQCM